MELNDYLRVLRAYWKGIAALLAAGLAVAGIWNVVQPRVYTAEASGYVAALGATDLGTSMVGDELARAKVKSYLDIGSWRAVAEYAIGELQLSTSPEQLVDQVKVTNPVNTVILQVAASAATPEQARDLAEVWIRGVIRQVELIEGAGGMSPPVTVIPGDSARLPTAPSSPNTRLNLALGALVGLLLGAGYAVARDRMDQRIRSASGLEKATGLAVVGSLPIEPALAKQPNALPLSEQEGHAPTSMALSEAFRALRTNLRYMSVDDPPRAIVVTSPLPGDGKSFTAANLALAVAATGQRVVLVDGDLRRPRLATLFGLPEGGGLTDVLAGRALVGEVLQPAAGNEQLQVLTSGPVPPNPSELLGSERMRLVIRELSAGALVIIDSPPLFPVTDAAVLSTRADGALLVLNAGRTTYDMLDHALDLLDKADGKLLGLVLNRVPTSGAGAVGTNLHYAGAYYRSSSTSAAQQLKAARNAPRLVPSPQS